MSPRARPQGAAAGYAMVAGSFLLVGLSGTLVTWAHAPESVLIVLRYTIAAVALFAVFWRRRPLAGVFRRGLWPKLLLMGVLDALTMLAYFYAVRSTSVAIASFLLFMQPVWVALLAPRLLRAPTERIVYLALAIALAGFAVILGPSLGGVSVSKLGLLVGLASGFTYTFFQLLVKGLTREVPSITIVVVEVVLDGLLILPLALWQTAGAGMRLTGRDWVAALILGLVCTAVAYTLWVDGMARVRVQHSAILGFLTPVAAPVFALVLLGQSIPLWTVLGGALILAAGALVIVLGSGEPEPEPPL